MYYLYSRDIVLIFPFPFFFNFLPYHTLVAWKICEVNNEIIHYIRYNHTIITCLCGLPAGLGIAVRNIRAMKYIAPSKDLYCHTKCKITCTTLTKCIDMMFHRSHDTRLLNPNQMWWNPSRCIQPSQQYVALCMLWDEMCNSHKVYWCNTAWKNDVRLQDDNQKQWNPSWWCKHSSPWHVEQYTLKKRSTALTKCTNARLHERHDARLHDHKQKQHLHNNEKRHLQYVLSDAH